MRYLRKEKISKLSDTKIIIPDCMRRISNFCRGSQKAHVSAQANRIIIVVGRYNANALIMDSVLQQGANTDGRYSESKCLFQIKQVKGV